MADYLNEEEQVEALKTWWNDNGKQILAGAGLALLLVSGYQMWKSKSQSYMHNAASIYNQVQELSEKKQSIDALAKTLKNDYEKSVYAQFAAMLVAKKAVDDGDLKRAEKELQWAIENGNDQHTKDLAALRLARVKLAQGEYDASLKVINGNNKSVYNMQLEELRGDLMLKKNDKAAAKKAYEQAYALAEADKLAVPVLRYKLQDLGGQVK